MKGKPISKEKLKKVSRFSTRAYDQTPRRRLPAVNWDLVKNMTDDDIDYSDIPETDEEFWADADWVIPENKVPLGVRFDRDVVDWFKKQGPGYQTRMNAVLRLYMERSKSKTTKSRHAK